VRAPLPFPTEIYLESTTFSRNEKGKYTEEGRRAAERLQRWILEGAVESFVVPMPGLSDTNKTARWEEKLHDKEERASCYANSGGYVVRHCHALIALWDGDPDPLDELGRRKHSGTADYVALKLNGGRPKYYPHKYPLGFRGERGPVLVVHTPRSGVPAKNIPGLRMALLPNEGEPQPTSILARRNSTGLRFFSRIEAALGLDDSEPESNIGRLVHIVETMLFGTDSAENPPTPEARRFREASATLDDFNADVARHEKELRPLLKETVDKLGGAAGAGTPLAPSLIFNARLQDTADGLACLARAQMERWQTALFAVMLIALISFHVYLHGEEKAGEGASHCAVCLWIFLIGIISAGGFVVNVWWERLDQRSLDYRSLAEALRVRCFWALAGLKDSVADSYLSQLRGEMAWVRQALWSVCPPTRRWRSEFEVLGEEEKKRRIELVRANWVAEQARYFKETAQKNHRWASLLRFAGFGLAMAGWFFAFLLLFCGREGTAPGADPFGPLLLASSLLALFGGFLLVICERRFHESLAKHYGRLHTVFADGLIELEQNIAESDPSRIRETLRALGNEALAEHAQWLILRRARPFELHIG
jgi:hypothetical protein